MPVGSRSSLKLDPKPDPWWGPSPVLRSQGGKGGDREGGHGYSFGGHPVLLPSELPSPTQGLGGLKPRKSLGGQQQQCFTLGFWFFFLSNGKLHGKDANLAWGQPRLPASQAPGPQHHTPFPWAPPILRVRPSSSAAQQGPRCQRPRYGHQKDVDDLQVPKHNMPKGTAAAFSSCTAGRIPPLGHGNRVPWRGSAA